MRSAVISLEEAQNRRWPFIFVGSGFATTFFLAGMRHRHNLSDVLVIERGPLTPHAEQIANRRNSPVESGSLYQRSGAPNKHWMFTIGAGGGSNCWWACTPRFMPADFELQSRYGVGMDWPIGYDDLEEHYSEVEWLMEISGPSDSTVWPRSRPYPLPPHIQTSAHAKLSERYGDQFGPMPCARSSTYSGSRARCCANGVCDLCPHDAKFTILNMTDSPFDAGANLLTETEVTRVGLSAGGARSVYVSTGGRDLEIFGDTVFLGANALFNAEIMMRSGVSNPNLGKFIHEQSAIYCDVELASGNGFDGSTSIPSHGYFMWDGSWRRESAAVLLEGWSAPIFRGDAGKNLQRVRFKLIAEAMPSAENHVRLGQNKPVIHYLGDNAYTKSGLDRAKSEFEKVLTEIYDLEDIRWTTLSTTEAHIQGTARMARTAKDGVVDDKLRVHGVEGLYALGASCFSSCSPANPTLTLSAISHRAGALL